MLHLMPDGTVKTQRQIEAELLELFFPQRDQRSIFACEEQALDEQALVQRAYVLQNDRIGFPQA